ncbi:unnamed protein product [Dibothriocephalus latus]|uniref:Uncharacterized protein n=1 Tax=Dibothriocephalus latus TaxID=60516 RepID=A0A3P7MCQ7_DIBLA|nr:unnamed protein product [Dibothriocephalus latus]
MTSLSLILLFAVAQALVCLASPSYHILEVEDEKDVMSEDLKLTAEDKKKEEVDSFNEDDVELKAEEVKNILVTAGLRCHKICRFGRCGMHCIIY